MEIFILGCQVSRKREEKFVRLRRRGGKDALALDSPCKYLLVGQVVSRVKISSARLRHAPRHPSSILLIHPAPPYTVAFSRSARSIRIANCKPTWKICLREKRARRSSRPSLFSNFSATDKQHATIYYNNTTRACIVARASRSDGWRPLSARVPIFRSRYLKRTSNEEAAFTTTAFSIGVIPCDRASARTANLI